MNDQSAKLDIEETFFQFELNLQNNYKDIAYEQYKKVHELLDDYFEQGKITKWYYRKFKKKMKIYDVNYGTVSENETIEEN